MPNPPGELCCKFAAVASSVANFSNVPLIPARIVVVVAGGGVLVFKLVSNATLQLHDSVQNTRV